MPDTLPRALEFSFLEEYKDQHFVVLHGQIVYASEWIEFPFVYYCDRMNTEIIYCCDFLCLLTFDVFLLFFFRMRTKWLCTNCTHDGISSSEYRLNYEQCNGYFEGLLSMPPSDPCIQCGCNSYQEDFSDRFVHRLKFRG